MGLFGKLFEKKSSKEIAFSSIGTDMHSHLIPGIDDGSKDVEDSLRMIRKFKDYGYAKLITTPHIMSDFYRNTPDIIHSGLDKVRAAMSETDDLKNMQVEAAAEYYLDADFNVHLKKKSLLTFGVNYVLVEVSYLNEPDGIESVFFNIQMAGYKPVLAHPERYPFWMMNIDKFEEFVEKGVLLQLNINSLTKHYGPGAQKTAEKLIEKGLISFIGSDCHKQDHLHLMSHVKNNYHLERLLESGTLLNSGV